MKLVRKAGSVLDAMASISRRTSLDGQTKEQYGNVGYSMLDVPAFGADDYWPQAAVSGKGRHDSSCCAERADVILDSRKLGLYMRNVELYEPRPKNYLEICANMKLRAEHFRSGAIAYGTRLKTNMMRPLQHDNPKQAWENRFNADPALLDIMGVLLPGHYDMDMPPRAAYSIPAPDRICALFADDHGFGEIGGACNRSDAVQRADYATYRRQSPRLEDTSLSANLESVCDGFRIFRSQNTASRTWVL